jgi:excisionase family DNA binding protein
MNETKLEVYTVPEVGKLLGINRNLAYELARQGQIPCIKLGRRLVCPKAAVDRWLTGAGDLVGREHE